MRAFFGRENFPCAIPHIAFWSRDRSRTHMVHILLLYYPKKTGSISSLPKKF
jgi:hypothetical protein